MSKKKVLEVCAKLNIGGAQAVAANISHYADDSFIFHYLVFSEEIGEYEQAITNRGNRIIRFPAPSANFIAHFRRLIRLMRQESYSVVHCHTMFNCGLTMLAAKIAHVPCRISHSHTTNPEQSKTLLSTIYRFAMRILIRSCSNEYIACGIKAGEALYGKRWFDKYGSVISNGIDISAYRFNTDTRSCLRNKLHADTRFIIGHVGHYEAVKNQGFLIDLMPEIISIRPNALLLLYGEGSFRPRLEAKIKEQNLQEYVRLMGNVNNIPAVLSAFDVFAFPSLFEGTPLALIEAQANGLPCVISDTIPEDACLTGDIFQLPLESHSAWIDALAHAQRIAPEEKAALLLSRYDDIQTSMERLYALYKKHQ